MGTELLLAAQNACIPAVGTGHKHRVAPLSGLLLVQLKRFQQLALAFPPGQCCLRPGVQE